LAQIGKERGLTSLYIGSDRKAYGDLLAKQRKSTDKTVAQLRSELVTDNGNLLPFLPKILGETTELNTHQYNMMLKNLGKLPQVRKEADAPQSDFKTVFFDGYTKTFSTPIMQNLLQINNFALDTEIASLVATLSELYTVKENAGLERGNPKLRAELQKILENPKSKAMLQELAETSSAIHFTL